MSAIAEKVKAFHKKFGLDIVDRPSTDLIRVARKRFDHISEEVNVELTAALGIHEEYVVEEPNLVEIADALADTVYLCYGMALQLGIPLDVVLAEVHRTNMKKVRTMADDKKIGIAKPAGWSPPDVRAILIAAGWTPPESAP